LTPDALAKAAREKLALALNALQTSPDTPVDLLDLAEPIAQTMGILHRIERSQGKDLTGRDQVLANIRGALNSLQTMTESHPAIDAVMEQVAGCLASAHQLARYEAPAAAPAPAPAPAPAAPAPAAPAPAVAAPAGLAPVVPTAPGGVAASVTAQIPPPQPSPPVVHADPFSTPAQVVPAAPHVPSAPIVPQPANMQQTMQLPPTAPAAPSPPPGTGPSNTVRMQGDQVPEIAQAKALAAQAAHVAQQQDALRQAHEEAARLQAQAAQQVVQAKQAPAQAFQAAVSPQSTTSSRPAPTAAGQSGNVIVELGTHSISNFYKGLGGNDVIEAGGIFVGTYKIPKLGAQVNLRVCLPGDYEFQATGTVQWIREPSQSGEGSEPGFGARFTQITPEGRQLVYRYTRNREPMFYDDL
jgi:hypothetical protein